MKLLAGECAEKVGLNMARLKQCVRGPAGAKAFLPNLQKIGKSYAKSYINRFSDQFRFSVFYPMFIKFGLMGWILIDFALLIALEKSKMHMCCLFVFFFSVKECLE